MINKTYIVASTLALTSVINAQTLFVEDPNEDQGESLPLQYTVSASVGYDDHFTSTDSSEGSDSIYTNAALGVNYVNASPQTTWKIGAHLSASKFSEDDRGGSGVFYNARLNLDLNHRINARTRFVSSNYVSYGLEPDYSFSFSENGAPTENLFYNLDNAIGHRWTTRLGTYTGVRLSGVEYFGSNSGQDDRLTYSLYNTFRYSLTPRTILTTSTSWARTKASGSAGDSTDILATVGLDHKLSPRSYVTAQAGVNYRNVSGGRDGYTNPHISASLNNSINSRLRLRTFIRYGIENFGTSQGVNTFDTNQAIRVGFRANYTVSSKLSLNAGINYIRYDFSDGRNTATNTSISGEENELINPYIGFTYRVNSKTSVNASYHYTDSSSSFRNTDDFQRNRVQLGVSRVF